MLNFIAFRADATKLNNYLRSKFYFECLSSKMLGKTLLVCFNVLFSKSHEVYNHSVDMLSLFDFIYLTHSHEGLVNFLIQHGVILETINCEKCDNILHINEDTLIFKCRKRHTVINMHRKRVSKQCSFEKSAKAGTWFDRSNLDVGSICKIVACFLMLRHPRYNDTCEETGVSEPTVVDWFDFCREVCHLYFF